MDFIAKLSESLNFTWRNKKLWVFGFFLALAGGSSTSSQLDFDSSEFSGEIESISSTESLILGLTFLSVFLILGLFVWYLSSIAKGAVITAIQEGKENPGIRESWKDGEAYVFKYIIMDVVYILVNIVILSPLIATVILGSFFPPLFIVSCCLLLIYLIYFIFAAMVYTGAQRLLVIENLSPTKALVRGYELAKEKFTDYFVGFLVFLIPSCAWQSITCFIAFIPAIFFVGVAALAIATGELFIMLAIIIPVVILIWVFAAIINSPFSLFGYTYWTKIVMDMAGHKEGVQTAEVIE